MKNEENKVTNNLKELELLAAYRECSDTVQEKILDIAKLYADKEHHARKRRHQIQRRGRI